MMFTVEEMNLICVYGIRSKAELLLEIRNSAPVVNDPEMQELMDSVLAKLTAMSDEEFALVSFYEAADEGKEG